MQILTYLFDIFLPPRYTDLLIRRAPEDALLSLYHPRNIYLEGLRIISLLPYKEPLVRACVTEAKFQNNKKAQRMLAHILAIHLTSLPIDKKVALIPIPLGAARRKERGYNQVEEVTSIALVSKGLDREDIRFLTDILVRTRETSPQTATEGAKRRENLKKAFGFARTPDSSYLYIVLDDVVTTGATLSAANLACIQNGIERISLMALAH